MIRASSLTDLVTDRTGRGGDRTERKKFGQLSGPGQPCFSLFLQHLKQPLPRRSNLSAYVLFGKRNEQKKNNN